MLNQIVLVGRLKEIKEIKEELLITIATPRPFKNEDGEYETDYFDILVRNELVQNVKEYCNIDDLIGIKGRLEQIKDSVIPAIVAEKITFLKSGGKDE